MLLCKAGRSARFGPSTTKQAQTNLMAIFLRIWFWPTLTNCLDPSQAQAEYAQGSLFKVRCRHWEVQWLRWHMAPWPERLTRTSKYLTSRYFPSGLGQLLQLDVLTFSPMLHLIHLLVLTISKQYLNGFTRRTGQHIHSVPNGQTVCTALLGHCSMRPWVSFALTMSHR